MNRQHKSATVFGLHCVYVPSTFGYKIYTQTETETEYNHVQYNIIPSHTVLEHSMNVCAQHITK